jgi:hypothetical protein
VISPCFIIITSSSFPVGTVTFLAHGGHILHWDIALWTWKQAKVLNAGEEYFLQIVSRIHEDVGIETTLFPIVAFHDNAMAVGINKIIAKDVLPLLMEEFSLAMG